MGFEPTCRLDRQLDFESSALWPLRYFSLNIFHFIKNKTKFQSSHQKDRPAPSLEGHLALEEGKDPSQTQQMG